MNSIRQIQELNKRELENNVSPEASWHTDYRDTAYIYIGGLPFTLSEGDVITIFSQYGEPTYINLIRDKETGKSRGFCFLKYEDQRSTDLAVDNMGGGVIMGRTLKVDHTRYKKKDSEEDGQFLTYDDENDGTEKDEEQRPVLREERELQKLLAEHDDDDPMKAFLIEEKREGVVKALAKIKGGKGEKSEKKRKHRHRHRSHREKDDGKHRDEKSSHRREEDRERRRSRSREGSARREDGQQNRTERQISEEYRARRSPRRESRERRYDSDRVDGRSRRRRVEPMDDSPPRWRRRS
ncbi:hypothetical protein BJ878DRAFT_59057 [Calycina marina]|uniref:RRM domain-containing protein n=1 Tax=Calycina marina TaxID=1763456 RepID=A0A9P8CFA6_9HELO|nr:hypothetical protein BJ878DRAFT_59057 [Calycina marina]